MGRHHAGPGTGARSNERHKMKVKEKVKVSGEPVRAAGGHPLATGLVENNHGNLCGRSSWLALATLAGALLRLFGRGHRHGACREHSRSTSGALQDEVRPR